MSSNSLRLHRAPTPDRIEKIAFEILNLNDCQGVRVVAATFVATGFGVSRARVGALVAIAPGSPHIFQMVHRCWHLIVAMFRLAGARNLDLIAAGVGFYALLGIFPAVAAVIALWGFVADPLIVDEQLQYLKPFMPIEAFALMETQVLALIATNSSTLGWATLVSVLLALWTTRAGVGALVRGLNAVYGAAPMSGYWHSLRAVMMTLILIGLSLGTLVAVIVVPVILVFLPLGPMTQTALIVARWTLLIAVGLSGLWLLYRFGPNHCDRSVRWTSPGAVLALLLWAAAAKGLTFYILYFGAYNQIYGALGAVIILMMWFFLTAYAVLLGAALNAVLAQGTGTQAPRGP